MSSKAREEIKALEGLRQARLAKYNEALNTTKTYEQKEMRKVKQLKEERKDVEKFYRTPTKLKKKVVDPELVGQIDPKIRTEYENLMTSKSSLMCSKSSLMSSSSSLLMSPTTEVHISPTKSEEKDTRHVSEIRSEFENLMSSKNSLTSSKNFLMTSESDLSEKPPQRPTLKTWRSKRDAFAAASTPTAQSKDVVDTKGLMSPTTLTSSNIEGKVAEAQQQQQNLKTWRSKREAFGKAVRDASFTKNVASNIATSEKSVPQVVTEQTVKDQDEQEAKSQLARILDNPKEKVSTEKLDFASIRKRYLVALDNCRPTAISVPYRNTQGDLKKLREARRAEAAKRDQYVQICSAWDKYEATAQDRPTAREKSANEILDENEVQKKEDEIVDAWVGYAKTIATEGGADGDDRASWIADSQRLRSETEARRRAKLLDEKVRLQQEGNETHRQKKDDKSIVEEDAEAAKKAQRKTYGSSEPDDSLPGKKFKKGSKYGLDCDSDCSYEGGSTSQLKQHRKMYGVGESSEGPLAGKTLKKGRKYGFDSDSDSDDNGADDNGGDCAQRKLRKKNYDGGNDSDKELAGKAFKKGRQYAPDSDSDSDDKGGANAQRELRKKNYGENNDSDGDLGSKKLKKGRNYGSESDSDTDDKGGATAQRARLKKNYGDGNDSDVALNGKKFKKGRNYGPDSDSDPGDNGGAGTQCARRKKSYDDGNDSEVDLGGKKLKKGRNYGPNSDSDTDDKGGSNAQRAHHKKNYDDGNYSEGDLGGKKSKKISKSIADSDSDADVAASAERRQLKKNYNDDGSDGGLEGKKNKKKTGFLDDSFGSDSSLDCPNSVNANKQRKKNFKNSDGSDNGLTDKITKKQGGRRAADSDTDHSVGCAKNEAPGLRKKEFNDSDDSDCDLRGKSQKKKGQSVDSESEKIVTPCSRSSKTKKLRKKNFNDSDSSDGGLRSKNKKSKGGQQNADSEDSESESINNHDGVAKDADNSKITQSQANRKSYGGGDSDRDVANGKQMKKGGKWQCDSDSDSDDEVLDQRARGNKKGKSSGASCDSDCDAAVGKKKKKNRGNWATEDSEEDDIIKTPRKAKPQVHGSKKGKSRKSYDASDSDDDVPYRKEKKKKCGNWAINDSDNGESDTSISCDEDDKSINLRTATLISAVDGEHEVSGTPLHRSIVFGMPLDGDNSDDNNPSFPKKKKQSLSLDDDETPGPPRNIDGSLWKNTLKGWHHTPSKKVVFKGTKIIVRVPERTDCWRKTRHNFVMDNAPFHWQKATGDFKAIVKISGGFADMYNKAGIMVRLDEENWILTGMEYFNNRVNHTTSYTVDHTDWSLAPLPENSERVGVWFCFKRIRNTYETFYSYDGLKWVLTRMGQFTERPVLYVGLCCACPSGKEFRVTFDCFSCSSAA